MNYGSFAGAPANLMLRGPAVTLSPDDGAGGGEAAAGDDGDPPEGDDGDAGDETGEGSEGEGGADDDGLEEVEWGGGKHRLPASIREALTRHDTFAAQDAELTNTRQTFERQRAASIEADTALRADYGKAHALAAAVDEFKALDWAGLQAADPATAQALWFDYQKAKEASEDAQTGLKAKVEAHAKGVSDLSAAAMKACGLVLSRDIPGFNGAVATRMVEFGMKKFGISGEEVREMTDPRVWKLLHAAMGNEKDGRTAAVKDKLSKQQAVAPAAKVGTGRANPPAALSDRSGTDAWMKARTAELAKRK